MIKAYFNQVSEGLEKILLHEQQTIEQAAHKVSDCIKQGGIIHVFGCGHSHMMAEELFYRAGGLAAVNPILIEPLMLHEGALKSSQFERSNEFGNRVLREYNFARQDIVIVVSTSGRNPVPIDAAIYVKEHGCHVIALTSLDYLSLPSRHKSGSHLVDVADITIHNHVEKGDAVLTHPNIPIPFSPVSSIHNIVILQAMFSRVIELMAESGILPPIFLSGNLDDADDHNLQLINFYEDKIPLLKDKRV